MEKKLTKENVYVPIANKKEAKQAKAVLKETVEDKNLINFKRPLVWMTGIEKHGNYQPNGFIVFLTFCALGLAYFAYQTFVR